MKGKHGETRRRRERAAMMTPSTVTIVVNGSIIPSFAPARILAGHVIAPLTPVVVRLASRTAYDRATATVSIERVGVRIVVRVELVENGVPYVALAPIVRAIGGSEVFDAATKTLAIAITAGEEIGTPVPFDPGRPVVAPTTVFTPQPPPPTPRSTDNGVPRPRRTAIPASPSQPAGSSPNAEPTNPRRSGS